MFDTLDPLTASQGALRTGQGLVPGVIAPSPAVRCFQRHRRGKAAAAAFA